MAAARRIIGHSEAYLCACLGVHTTLKHLLYQSHFVDTVDKADGAGAEMQGSPDAGEFAESGCWCLLFAYQAPCWLTGGCTTGVMGVATCALLSSAADMCSHSGQEFTPLFSHAGQLIELQLDAPAVCRAVSRLGQHLQAF